MKIILQKLYIKNFKGIKEQIIEFSQKTEISGQNGLGKTTIQDAFNYLLFGKNREDVQKFNIQPLGEDKMPIHNLETVVEATISFDSTDYVFKKVFKERYTKKRGESTAEFRGYDTDCYIDDTPVKVTEFKTRMAALVDEDVFKLITNPLHFQSLHWTDRRKIIIDVVGEIADDTVISANEKLLPLREHLDKQSFEDFTKKIKSQINKLKEDNKKIYPRIDEVKSMTKQVPDRNFKEEMKILMEQEKELEGSIRNKAKQNETLIDLKNFKKEACQDQADLQRKAEESKKDKINSIDREIYSLESELSNLKRKAIQEQNKPYNALLESIARKQREISNAKNEIRKCNEGIQQDETFIEKATEDKAELLARFHKKKDEVFEFDETTCVCPTCKQSLPEINILEQKIKMKEEFNIAKVQAETDIKKRGVRLKGLIIEANAKITSTKLTLADQTKFKESLEGQLATLVADKQSFDKGEPIMPERVIDLENKIELMKNNLSILKESKVEADSKWFELEEDIKQFDEKINNFKIASTEELEIELSQIKKEVDLIKSFKNVIKQNEDLAKRVSELETQEKNTAEKIAELETLQIKSEEFVREKTKFIEAEVDKKFKLVQFKMFENQVNGGLAETCEPCIKGVPFTNDLNTAAKINGGIDIINTLSTHYGIYAPIFVDNRERINSWNLIGTESQLITMRVTDDEQIKISEVK